MTELLGCRELDDGWEAYAKGRLDEALTEAQKYTSSTNIDLYRDANKLAGQCFFDLKDAKKSLYYFTEAARGVEEANIWFNVMSAATNADEIDIAKDAFKKTLEYNEKNPTLPITMPPLSVHLYFAFSLCHAREYKLALQLINNLKPVYQQARITDDTYLFTRGIPMLYRFLDTAKMVFEGLDQPEEMREWMTDLAAKLDEEGEEAIERILNPTFMPLNEEAGDHSNAPWNDDVKIYPELEAAWKAYGAQNWDLTVESALPHTDAEDEELREEAIMLVARAYNQDSNVAAAIPYYQKIIARKENADNMLEFLLLLARGGKEYTNLIQEILSKLESMDMVKAKTDTIYAPRKFLAMIYNGLDQNESALEYLTQLRDKTTDYYGENDAELAEYNMSVSMIEETLYLANNIFTALGSEDAHQAWLADFAAKMGENGRKIITGSPQ